jgi:hypothetical protein
MLVWTILRKTQEKSARRETRGVSDSYENTRRICGLLRT